MGSVVDASVALKWVVEEEGSEKAAELQGESLVAPSIWLIEAGNALWSKARRREITQAEAAERLARLRRAPVRLAGVEQDTEAALELALLLDHPIYDCLYLALALRLEFRLITADKRFHAACGRSERCKGVVRLLDDLDRAEPTT